MSVNKAEESRNGSRALPYGRSSLLFYAFSLPSSPLREFSSLPLPVTHPVAQFASDYPPAFLA